MKLRSQGRSSVVCRPSSDHSLANRSRSVFISLNLFFYAILPRSFYIFLFPTYWKDKVFNIVIFTTEPKYIVCPGRNKEWQSAQARRETTGGPGQSGHVEASSIFRLWPMRQKEFYSGLRHLRHFEEFLRMRPLQSEVPQSTRPWGNLPSLPPISAGLNLLKFNEEIKIPHTQ